MYSTPVDLSFAYLRSAVEASLDIKKDQVDPNKCSLILIKGKNYKWDNFLNFVVDNLLLCI